MKRFYYLILVLIWPAICLAQPGSLDQTFGQGGKVVTGVTVPHNLINKILIQEDGKTVAIGYSTQVQYAGQFCLIRYNSDGSLDNSFGVNGVVETQFGTNEDVASSGVIQPDGKIIASGYTWNGSNHDFAMVRYEKDGSIDLTFGVAGVVKTDFYGENEQANSIALQPDGKVIIAGYSQDLANFDINIALARYSSDGVLDSEFGDNGKVIIGLGQTGVLGEADAWQLARGIALQQDGEILLTGFTELLNDANQAPEDVLMLLRIKNTGRLDDGFGVNGVVTTKIGFKDVGSSVDIQADGKIIVLGTTRPVFGGYDDMLLVRYKSTGELDNSFGNNGIVKTVFSNTDDVGGSLALQSDQKIVAVGFTAVNNGSTLDFAMARYNTDGTLDNSFDGDGKVTTDFNGNWDVGTCLAIQNNGKIVIGGYTFVNNDHKFAIAKYNNDAALPVTLATFDAIKQENHVLLRWKTTSEENSDRIEVHRSVDGKKWDTIGSIKTSIDSQREKEYELLDQKPNAGKNLYRLRMTDLDESFSYSRIRSVLMDQGEFVKVYPNPASGTLKIHLVNKGNVANSELLNHLGRQVYHSREFAEEINLEGISSGMYSLVLTFSNGSKYSSKVVVEK
ncbi:T9SS type A sorting domain-containing protein [Dyadobacter pollutisoli]|uniref:T9SS type A sorting domain-containing protein n=1 Tax=Dyadobacter pollutisoli TaxID=2910158 RepID=A0A9E8NC29_9BACT|nr:T9SS type A sorting domain-containing protein [Dyadobacter pollutisoli]WAC13850.1 T9SS type A sorting domain-containing protein [Dyadobacter pollutisoli]